MKLITNAIVYKAELPDAELLAQHLAELPYAELAPEQLARTSFVPHKAFGDLVQKFEGGLAFCARTDEKVLPPAAIKAELEKRIEQIQNAEGRKPGKKEIKAVKEQVYGELVRKALVKHSTVVCYYDTQNQYLIVPVSNKGLADRIISALIRTVGSVKTTTIHVSDVKGGITTRLKNWLEGDDEAFGEMQLDGEVQMQGESGRISISLNSLDNARQAITEALEAGFSATSARLSLGAIDFRLTSDFHLKSIGYNYTAGEDADDALELWQHEAAFQVLELGKVINHLCDLLGYKPPEQQQEAA